MASKVAGYAGKYNPGNGTQYSLGSTAYGYCETAADTAAKVVDMTGFILMEGATVFIKFQYENTANNPTLNVQGTGAKPIINYGTSAAGIDSINGWPAGAVLCLTYDGTSWVRDFESAVTKGGSVISDVAVASFNSSKEGIPIPDLTIDVSPVQSGEGDPSPDNIRPISGWTGCNIVVSPTLQAADGTTYPVSWETEAGVVYGGTLNVTTGVLTVDRQYVLLDGTGPHFYYPDGTTYNPNLQKSSTENPNGYLYYIIAGTSGNPQNYPNVSKQFDAICNQRIYHGVATSQLLMQDFGLAINVSDENSRLISFVRTESTKEAVLAACATDPMQFVYYLKTPRTVQLTPTEVKTLLGANNIWADCGNIKLLKYYNENDAVFHDEIYDYLKDYKIKQSTVDSGTAETNKWISRIQQDENGNITPTEGQLDTSGLWNGNAGTATQWASAQKVYVTLGTASTTTTIQGGSSSAQTIGVNGTLAVGNGGTGATTFTSGALLIGNGANAVGTRAITNNTSNTAASASTNIPTMNTLYYTLAKINNADQTHAITIYAPTAGGTANTQALVGNGATTAPKWVNISPSSAWTAGTTEGPTLKVTVLGQTQETGAAIPSASSIASGIVTTGTQTFAGEKTFSGNVNLSGETSADSVIAGNLLVNGSASFTNIPTAPTASTGTNNTQLATTEFVQNAINVGDTRVNVVSRGTTKAYLLADTSAPSSTAAAHSAVAESGVFLDTTEGRLAATSFRVVGSANSSNYITSDSVHNIYFKVNDVTSLVVTDTAIRSATLKTGIIDLGTSAVKWNNVYANAFNGSGENLTSLNASNIASGTIAFSRLPSIYWANIEATSSAQYDKEPVVKTITVGNGSGATAPTKKVQLIYDASLEVLNFVFS